MRRGGVFVPPAPTLHLSLSITLVGAVGVAPIGPQGVFVPAPPGSRAGLIVPAPLGTPPAVVTGAPAIVHEGMHIVAGRDVTINENTTINRITNVRNVAVIAPPTATREGLAFRSDMPARADLAARVPARTHWQAPLPQSHERLRPMGEAGRPLAALPAAPPVHVGPLAAPAHEAAAPLARPPAHQAQAQALEAAESERAARPERVESGVPRALATPETPEMPQAVREHGRPEVAAEPVPRALSTAEPERARAAPPHVPDRKSVV